MSALTAVASSVATATNPMDDVRAQMRGFTKTGIDAAAKALGLSTSDLRDQLRSGKSLKDIAATKNVDFSKVQGAINEAVKPQLDQAVQSGALSAAQAKDVLTQLTSGDAPTQSGSAHHQGGHRGGGAVKSGMDAAAKVLGVSSSDLMDQLRAGKSLKDIAAAQNVDFSKVQTAMSQSTTYSLGGLPTQSVGSGQLVNVAA